MCRKFQVFSTRFGNVSIESTYPELMVSPAAGTFGRPIKLFQSFKPFLLIPSFARHIFKDTLCDPIWLLRQAMPETRPAPDLSLISGKKKIGFPGSAP